MTAEHVFESHGEGRIGRCIYCKRPYPFVTGLACPGRRQEMPIVQPSVTAAAVEAPSGDVSRKHGGSVDGQ